MDGKTGNFIFAPCNGKGKGQRQVFNISGINRIISRSKEKGDELHTILASRVASEGDSLSIHAHKKTKNNKKLGQF